MKFLLKNNIATNHIFTECYRFGGLVLEDLYVEIKFNNNQFLVQFVEESKKEFSSYLKENEQLWLTIIQEEIQIELFDPKQKKYHLYQENIHHSESSLYELIDKIVPIIIKDKEKNFDHAYTFNTEVA